MKWPPVLVALVIVIGGGVNLICASSVDTCVEHVLRPKSEKLTRNTDPCLLSALRCV